jgi:hypothetical protein
MANTVVYKKDHTTRIAGEVYVDDVLLDLTDKSIEVKLKNASSGAVVTLALGSGVTLGGSTGSYFHDVTAGAPGTVLDTLGNPDEVVATVNVWTADNQLVVTGSGVIRTEY